MANPIIGKRNFAFFFCYKSSFAGGEKNKSLQVSKKEGTNKKSVGETLKKQEMEKKLKGGRGDLSCWQGTRREQQQLDRRWHGNREASGDRAGSQVPA